MPYYCTVPRCTSMAGKVQNVSFHQFPRDEELAKLWNEILKRGKPYTKYSKVCSLHFKPEDYTITALGRNKGQSRTLRKDAVPSQNLPSDLPILYEKNKSSGRWVMKSISSDMTDSQLHQVAQCIYNRTVLAIHASGASNLSMTSICSETDTSLNGDDSTSRSSNGSSHFNDTMSQIEHLLIRNNINYELNSDSTQNLNNNENLSMFPSEISKKAKAQDYSTKHTYKCDECSKCFKDPDVYLLHKRIHKPKNANGDVLRDTFPEKENFNSDASNNHLAENSPEETLRANPILANLLKSTMAQTLHKGVEMQNLDNKKVKNIEDQIMTDLASKMKNYFRNLSMTQKAIVSKGNMNIDHSASRDDNSEFSNGEEETMDEGETVIQLNKSDLDMQEDIDSNCYRKDYNQ